MACFGKKITSCLLLLIYAWALFLGEATHRFIHHLHDEASVHEHSLSCLSQSTQQVAADENQGVPTRNSFMPTKCALELALHVFQGQQGQSQFFIQPIPHTGFSSPLLTGNVGPFKALHHVFANHTRGSPLV